MEVLAIYNRQEIAPAQDLTADLFMDFVAFIDRSEKTASTYIKNLRQFIAWLKYTNTPRPVRKDIILYRNWLTVEHEAVQLDPVTGWKYRTGRSGNPIMIHCKPSTVAQYLRSVKQFFAWTGANNHYPDIAKNIHAPKIATDNHRKEHLNPAEVLQIEKSIAQKAQEATQAAAEAVKDTAGKIQRTDEQGKRLYAMYLLTVNAGLRTVEISRANIKDLVTKDGKTWLYVWGKGRTEPDQKKPIAPEVKAAIVEYLQSRTDNPTGNSPLFVSTGNRSKGKRIATTTISTMLKQAMKEAGFDSERITAHSLRHSAAMAALKVSGNNIYTAQKYMRHANANTTGIYLHETDDTDRENRETAQSIYNLFHGGSTGQDNLESIIARLNPKQRTQLESIAAAMV